MHDTTTITFRLPIPARREAEGYAEKQAVTLSRLVGVWIQEKLEKQRTVGDEQN